MFASYVIYSIKQTGNLEFFVKILFASYVIYSIKQTWKRRQEKIPCLLVMLFIVLSKHNKEL